MTRYYKNLNNKLRFDIRAAMQKNEPLFFSHFKPRSKDTRGRDKLRWYNETQETAQVSHWLDVSSVRDAN